MSAPSDNVREEILKLARKPREEQVDLLIKAAQVRAQLVGQDEAFRDAMLHAWDFGGLAAIQKFLDTRPVTEALQ